jgi:hypothetical protein
MKMGVDDSNDGFLAEETQLFHCALHLFDRFTSVDRDDTLRSPNERLVREAIPDQAPHPIGDFIHPRDETLGVLVQRPVSNSTLRVSNNL